MYDTKRKHQLLGREIDILEERQWKEWMIKIAIKSLHDSSKSRADDDLTFKTHSFNDRLTDGPWNRVSSLSLSRAKPVFIFLSKDCYHWKSILIEALSLLKQFRSWLQILLTSWFPPRSHFSPLSFTQSKKDLFNTNDRFLFLSVTASSNFFIGHFLQFSSARRDSRTKKSCCSAKLSCSTSYYPWSFSWRLQLYVVDEIFQIKYLSVENHAILIRSLLQRQELRYVQFI